jgi:hypothetical protein
MCVPLIPFVFFIRSRAYACAGLPCRARVTQASSHAWPRRSHRLRATLATAPVLLRTLLVHAIWRKRMVSAVCMYMSVCVSVIIPVLFAYVAVTVANFGRMFTPCLADICCFARRTMSQHRRMSGHTGLAHSLAKNVRCWAASGCRNHVRVCHYLGQQRQQ